VPWSIHDLRIILVEQWQDELKEKFDLTFDIVSREQIETSVTGNPFAKNVVDTDAMQCGHYIAEEMPDHVYERFVTFFRV
jgi:hypothetical protein